MCGPLHFTRGLRGVNKAVIKHPRTVSIVRLHVLRLEHGNRNIKRVAAGVENGLLAGAETRDGVGAAVGALLDGGVLCLVGLLRDWDGHGRGGEGEGEKTGELHGGNGKRRLTVRGLVMLEMLCCLG